MHNRTTEDSPLLAGEAGMIRDWDDGGRQGSGRALLEGAREKSRRKSWHDGGGGGGGDGGAALARRVVTDAFRRRWRVSAAVAGVVMFSMALAGLVAIFSTIQSQRAPASSGPSTLEQIKETVPVAPALELPPSTATPVTRRTPRSSRGEQVIIKVHGEKEDEGQKKVEGEEKDEWTPPVADAGGPGKGGDRSKGRDQSKPNVFFIMIDDMGWNDIGYQSIDLEGVTPNLDKLAAGGVKLTNYYSMSICTPARASLMTGRYVVRYGLQYSVIQPGAPWGLPVSEKIFPQYMKDAGYETHMIGKWHLGSYRHELIPSERGFDTYMGYLNDEEMYWTHQSWSASMNGRKFFDFGFGNATGYYDIIDRPVPDHNRTGSLADDADDDGALSPTSELSSSVSPTWSGNFRGKYSTQVFQNRAIDILEEKKPFDEEPLFMYLAHQAVHDPLGLPPDGSFSPEESTILDAIEANSDSDGHLRKRFAKVLMYLDHTIGELVEYLEDKGWMENSIIVVASDNGGCPSIGGGNYPLRGIKHSYWEGGVKVPAFVYSKSHIPESRWGMKYNGVMHVTDWLPTLATGAGFDLRGSAGPLDGIDHWEYVVNAELTSKNSLASPREEMLYNFDPYILWTSSHDSVGNEEFQLAQGAFRQGKYKLISNEWCSGWYTFDKKTLERDQLTNLTTACDGSPCSDCGQGCTSYTYADYLFDLEADPREENNLIDVHPDVAHGMRDRWVEIALSDFTNSSYENIDHQAYYVWAKHNWWMIPWWNQVGAVTEDSSGLNSTTSTSSSSVVNSTSWTSTLSSSQ